MIGRKTMQSGFTQRSSLCYVPHRREDTKVSHYIINKIQQNDQIVYRIGDQSFADLPELLAFYKLHYLDTTPLRRPAQKKVERVIGKFDFDGSVSWKL
jgi:C-crk adapter molecule crk